MTNSINRWGEDIPEPMAAFNYRAINPKNIELETRRAQSKVLPKRELKRVMARKRQLDELLKATDFFTHLKEFQRLSGHRANLVEALVQPGDDRERLQEDLAHTDQLIARLRVEHEASIRAFKEYKKLSDLVSDHTYAVMREEYAQKLNMELAKEAEYFQQIIIETWARLGYKHDMLDRRGRRLVHRVGISEMQIVGGDQIWLKIDTTRKTLGRNFKSTLPYGVRVAELVAETTCFELSTACQRQVTAITNNNGAWIVVNRLNTVDGIKTYVTYDEIMKGYRKSDRAFLPIPMGVGLRDEVSWVMMAHYPHVLIGGTTGGGKSNMINVIISTLIGQHSPAEVQLVLLDLKEGLEFQYYEKVPHLLRPVVTSVEEAAQVMLQLEQLRAERGRTLREVGVKDIDEYNEVMERRGLPAMPRVAVVFDEFGAIDTPFAQDLRKSILASAIQLVNKARASGIHLILCTQRPSVDVVPGHIKDNMAFRIAGFMPTTSASSTILGVGDAAALPLIKGRMMAMANALKWQLQTPHIKRTDIEMAVRKAMKWAENTIDGSTPRVLLPEAKGSIGFGEDDLISLIMEDFSGMMIFTQLWEVLKESGLVSYKELQTMTKKLKAEHEFEYEGARYRLVTQKGGHSAAELITDDEAEVAT